MSKESDKEFVKAVDKFRGKTDTAASESALNDLLSRNGWGLRRHVENEIIVSNKNGSFVALQKGTEKNSVGVTESLFYDMMNDFLVER